MFKPSDWDDVYRLEATAERCRAMAERDSQRATADDYDDLLFASGALSTIYPSRDGIEVRAAPCAMQVLADQCRECRDGESVPLLWSHRHWLADAALQLMREAHKRRGELVAQAEGSFGRSV